MKKILVSLALFVAILGGLAGTHGLHFKAAQAQQSGCEKVSYTVTNGGAQSSTTFACGSPTPAPTACAFYGYTVGSSGDGVVSNYNCFVSNTPPPLPISVANGGTGTAAPSPAATATACGAAVSDTGSFPSVVTNVPVCGGTIFASTGQHNVQTGTTATVYVQLGSNVSITVPSTSNGANNEWLLTVNMDLSKATNSAQIDYMCATSSSTYNLEDSTTDAASQCQTATSPLTNTFMGGPGWGDNAVAAPGLSQHAQAHLLVANGATFTMACYAEGSTTVNDTLYGNCSVKAEAY
jgi:hypothetical protein